jgi:hypothetical protein
MVLAGSRPVYADNVVMITRYTYTKADGTTTFKSPTSESVSLPTATARAEIDACIGHDVIVTVTVVGGATSDTCQATITPTGGAMIALTSTHPNATTWKITIPAGTMTAGSNWVLDAPVKKQTGFPRGDDANNVAVKAYP